MDDKKIVFIVGLGAPASLYSNYLDDLKQRLPQAKVLVLEWWNQDDSGMSELQSYIGNSDVTLIGHSAGGVIALQALAKWPAQIKKIIMLDSHFLRTKNTLLKVSRMLDIMLSKDSPTLKNRVESAYAPIVDNSSAFDKALEFAIEWVNASFDEACARFNVMPAHSALHVGFTNSGYQVIGAEDERASLASWGKFGVDVKFLPMNHFDLIDGKYAANINQLIVDWLRTSPR